MKRDTTHVLLLGTILAAGPGCRDSTGAGPALLAYAVATEAVGDDADDPAVWVNRRDPARSLILGTNKEAAPNGALVAWDLAGRRRHFIGGLDRPNNVDVEKDVALGGTKVDIAVVTERYQRRLRAWQIREDALVEVGAPDGMRVFEGEAGERGAPMGIALFRRSRDGVVFAFVSRKEGPSAGCVWQYRLEDDSAGRLRAVKVRELGEMLPGAEVEAVLVDDALGYVYYAEEQRGIHKWQADPDHPEASRELALFATADFKGDREGLALYARPDGTGYLAVSDQVPGASRYHLFRRQGPAGSPHDHGAPVRIVEGGADSTDGLDATSESLGGAFPKGLLVAMNSRGRNFLLYRWEALGVD